MKKMQLSVRTLYIKTKVKFYENFTILFYFVVNIHDLNQCHIEAIDVNNIIIKYFSNQIGYLP